MPIKDTFLELSPEHGGVRFGPFSGMEIRLGSLPSPHNDISLPEDLGILPEHVKIVSQGDGSFVVAPIERSAEVYIWRSGMPAKKITSPIAVQSADDIYSADAFSVGSVEGPKFFVLQVEREKPKDPGNDPFSRAKKRLTGKSILDEIKRQGVASVVTTKGGAFFQYYWTFIKTGTIFQPRYLIMFFLIGCGWLTTGVLGLFNCSQQVDFQKQEVAVASCEEKLDLLGAKSEDKRTFRTEAARTLARVDGKVEAGQRKKWEMSLPDNDFTKEVKAQFKAIYGNPGDYRRFYSRANQGGEAIKALRKALESRNIPGEASRVLSFLAARDMNIFQRDWYVTTDSAGEKVCTRGPLRMSWRQAANLGFVDGASAVDALVLSDEWTSVVRDKSSACNKTKNTIRVLHASGIDIKAYRESCERDGAFPDSNEEPVTNDPNQTCLFTLESDARSVMSWDDKGFYTPLETPAQANWEPLADKLTRVFSGKTFPAYMNRHALVSRLLYFYLADVASAELFKQVAKEFKAAKDADDPPSDYLTIDGLAPTVPWAQSKAARVVAMAAAIPCLAVRDARKEDDDKALKRYAKNLGMLEDEMPSYIDCIVTDAMSKDK